MKKYFSHIITSVSCLGMTFLCSPGCKKAENITIVAAKPEKGLESFLQPARSPVVHLYHDTVYTYNDNRPFTREAGEQLIIDEGTVIRFGISASIRINQGGILIANGTPENPVVFTLAAAAGTQRANWGGITIQGRSYDNSVSASGDPADVSGSLRYARIEFAGLVLTGVGSGTTVDHVQVSYTNSQTAIEIDGGTFNPRYLVSYACGGPVDFYITRGYTGNMQHLLAYRHPFFGAKNSNPDNALAGMFIENNPTDTSKKPYTFPVLSNLTVLGPNGQNGSMPGYSDTISARSAALITTGNTHFRIRNSLLLGFPEGAWYLDDPLTAGGIAGNRSEFTWSILQCNDSARAFYLKPGTYPPFNSGDFKDYILTPSFNNQLFPDAASFKFKDPFNYDIPDPLPATGSPVLTGADFSGADYSKPFFTQVPYKGALGTDNWLKGWTNFTPLKTNYNFPQ